MQNSSLVHIHISCRGQEQYTVRAAIWYVKLAWTGRHKGYSIRKILRFLSSPVGKSFKFIPIMFIEYKNQSRGMLMAIYCQLRYTHKARELRELDQEYQHHCHNFHKDWVYVTVGNSA